jgi:hypothetical protein
MAIEDSTPERRNLTVLAASIILFYIGDGVIKDNTLTLEIINVEFSNTGALKAALWVMLCWFLFRYWVAHHHMIKDLINQELHGKKYGLSFFTQTIKRTLGVPENVSARNVHFVRYANNISSCLCLVDPVDPNDPQEYDESDRRHAMQPDVRDGFHLRLILFMACVRLFFTHPSLTAYYVPYLLAFTAITLGLCHEVAAIHPFFEWLCGIYP